MKRVTGRYITISTTGETVRAFIPAPLPPNPPLDLDAPLQGALDKALVALGRLDSITQLLPEKALFLYMYVRKEAVLSSQIEGTQSSLSDLLMFESSQVPGVPIEDVREVSNYVAALAHAMHRLRNGFPLSLRLLRETHAVLLKRGRGSDKAPGEFRRSQNWIGGTRPGNAMFVPPPPTEIMPCMGALEHYLHESSGRSSILVRTALAHAQFESIHPFLDGNGRVGRLLIPLMLHAEGVLSEPLLYLSLYFKRHRSRYYELLQGIRMDGEWESWLRFFAEGVRDTADQAVATAKQLVRLFAKDARSMEAMGRLSGSAMRVHNALQRHPISDIGHLAGVARLSVPTVTTVLRHLQGRNLVREITGRRRSRVFVYREYLHILNEGTERREG